MARERQPPTPPHLFQSFWIGGFEAACHITETGTRLDMIAATQHDRQVASDYALMKSLGMSTVRDAARWPLTSSSHRTPLSTARALTELCNRPLVERGGRAPQSRRPQWLRGERK